MWGTGNNEEETESEWRFIHKMQYIKRSRDWFKKIYFKLCVCVGVCVCDCWWPWRAEGSCPWSQKYGGHELPDMSTGTELESSVRAVHAVN